MACGFHKRPAFENLPKLISVWHKNLQIDRSRRTRIRNKRAKILKQSKKNRQNAINEFSDKKKMSRQIIVEKTKTFKKKKMKKDENVRHYKKSLKKTKK